MVSESLDVLRRTSRILQTQQYIQHGTTSVYTHCCNVAYVSLVLADTFHWDVDKNALVRGALLHDYFLYDWHTWPHNVSFHGYTHPAVALANAEHDMTLTPVEKDIIRHHMFPLTICPPQTREGLLISISDKLCSLYETFKMNDRRIRIRQNHVAR